MSDDFLSKVPISVEVDGLIHVFSKTVRFHRSKTVVCKIGALTIIWSVSEKEDGETKVVHEIDAKNLTLHLKIEGNIPARPLNFLSLDPEDIGRAAGYPIFISSEFDTVGDRGRWIELSFTLYYKLPAPPAVVVAPLPTVQAAPETPARPAEPTISIPESSEKGTT